MVDFGQIQNRLNTDARYRTEFLTDPVGFFRREGVVLSADMQTKLRLQVAHLSQRAPRAAGPAIPNVELKFSL